MQNTGQPQTKKLVLLKLNEINKGGGRAGGELSGVFGGAPFFKESLPIGDIIADCTAHSNEQSIKLTFVDSIYNTSTSYTFPACALPKLSQLKLKNSTGSGEKKFAIVFVPDFHPNTQLFPNPYIAITNQAWTRRLPFWVLKSQAKTCKL